MAQVRGFMLPSAIPEWGSWFLALPQPRLDCLQALDLSPSLPLSLLLLPCLSNKKKHTQKEKPSVTLLLSKSGSHWFNQQEALPPEQTAWPRMDKCWQGEVEGHRSLQSVNFCSEHPEVSSGSNPQGHTGLLCTQCWGEEVRLFGASFQPAAPCRWWSL